MSIVCGTDFSAAAGRALTAAAHLAASKGVRLHIVHSVQPDAMSGDVRLTAAHVEQVTELLQREGERARALGAEAHVELKHGSPDEALIAVARETAAELIVIGPFGAGASEPPKLGAHVELLVKASPLPVLVVRDGHPFALWLRERRPLRVVLGASFSRNTDAAVSTIDGWRRISPCEVTAVHLYRPQRQISRPAGSTDPEPELTKRLTRELTHRLASADEPSHVFVYVERYSGRLGDRLVDIAELRGADLLVVGCPEQGTYESSVSHAALLAARSSVLCVPAAAPHASAEAAPAACNVRLG